MCGPEKKRRPRIDLIMGTVGLVVMAACVLAGIIWRALGTPLLWTEEVAKWMMVWITFAGASYSFKNGGLLRVDYFTRTFLGAKAQKIVGILAMGITFVFFVYMTASSIFYMVATWNRNQVFSITRVPFFFIVAALFVGALLMSHFAAQQILLIVKGSSEENSVTPSDNIKKDASPCPHSR